MNALRRPTPRDILIRRYSESEYTLSHESLPEQLRCDTFHEALERAGRYAAKLNVNIWHEDRERARMMRLDERLIRRIWGEFLEQPGLALTRAQAQRLWALDEVMCADLLDMLTATRLLRVDATGRYRLSWPETSARGGTRMAKAELSPGRQLAKRD